MHKWSEKEKERLLQLRLNHTQQETADILSREFNAHFTRDMVKNAEDRLKQDEPVNEDYKSTVEILADGSHKSDILLKMSKEQSKDVNFLLKAHGYDKAEWELVSARNNIWNVYSKQDGIQVLYSSKITVKPKQTSLDYDRLIEAVKKTKPVNVNKKSAPLSETDYINIPLFDMHFGVSDYDYYKRTQEKILGRLDKRFKGVLFIIGQDLFHNDDFRGRTSSGREIEKVDMIKAWDDALEFYTPLIERALRHSDKVKIMYSKGNHSESVEWCFIQKLKGLYPEVEYDDAFKERKVHMLGRNFIGANHGDKKKASKLAENFATEFPKEWAYASTREVFTGHEHNEMKLIVDESGLVIRRMPTRNKIDDWHDDMGYTTAHKRFMLFEYSEEELEAIYYV